MQREMERGRKRVRMKDAKSERERAIAIGSRHREVIIRWVGIDLTSRSCSLTLAIYGYRKGKLDCITRLTSSSSISASAAAAALSLAASSSFF
eukprot:1339000-Amorphochlora_amoeboformis.AAC.1